ncbi:glucose PTS transporter transcription antiterminator GlcT [Bacillus nakamurai]|nr:transcription antiterminator [Bacillus nakamurai]MCC9023788.1 transcription antiterminator [Bacillus nakamurai]MCP6683186.1 transcription antiterminator [Bacillus nakamurai]MED1229726.1 transcription antiterminator [Bacillus nakamurai]
MTKELRIMNGSFTVEKVLNNNVLIATHDRYSEVVLIGKGIGFGKKQADVIEDKGYDKMFILKDEKEQKQFKKLLGYVDETLVDISNDVIYHIKKRTNHSLNEHIHIALTDHIAFAVKRLQQGFDIKNPFLMETESLYPEEFQIAREVVGIINEKTGICLPEGEIGFIALHIHSALTNRPLSEVNRHSQLMAKLVQVIEDSFQMKVDKESVHYLRLIRHIRFTIDRIKREEPTKEPEKLMLLLKNEYPLCYNTAWKLIKILQQMLKKPVHEAEAVYLTLHLYRLTNKIS